MDAAAQLHPDLTRGPNENAVSQLWMMATGDMNSREAAIPTARATAMASRRRVTVRRLGLFIVGLLVVLSAVYTETVSGGRLAGLAGGPLL